MKKINLISKILLTTTILSPVMLITPIVLTSCSTIAQNQDSVDNIDKPNDKPNEKPDNKPDGGDSGIVQKGKEIPITNLDKISPSMVNGNNIFNIQGIVDGKNLLMDKIYEEIVVNKDSFINEKLIKQHNFTQTTKSYKSNAIDLTNDNVFLEKSSYSTKSDASLLKIILEQSGMKLMGSSTQKTRNNNVKIDLSSLNFEELISDANIKCEINFIDSKDENKYEFKYTIKPNGDNYWKDVNDQYKSIPMVITFNKNIEDISIVNDISNFCVSTPKDKDTDNNFFKDKQMYFLMTQKKDRTQYNESNAFKNYIKDFLGVTLPGNLWTNEKIVVPEDKHNNVIELIKDIKQVKKSDGFIPAHIIFDWRNDGEKVNFNLDNLISQIKKNRLNINVSDPSTMNRNPFVYLQFELKNDNNIDYKWYGNSENISRKKVPITIKLEWSK